MDINKNLPSSLPYGGVSGRRNFQVQLPVCVGRSGCEFETSWFSSAQGCWCCVGLSGGEEPCSEVPLSWCSMKNVNFRVTGAGEPAVSLTREPLKRQEFADQPLVRALYLTKTSPVLGIAETEAGGGVRCWRGGSSFFLASQEHFGEWAYR